MLSDVQIRNYVQEEIFFSYAPPKEGTYTPTLVLGLGGTGMKVLRYLKKHLRRTPTQDLSFLAIDCDMNENEKWPELPKLSDSELMLLDPAPAVTRMAQAAKDPDAHRYLLEYLPVSKGERVNIHGDVAGQIRRLEGAGQFRRAGRLIFTSNAVGGCNLRGKLLEAQNALQGIVQRQANIQAGLTIAPNTRIFVVTSLAGGTGAGSLLDCLALLRTVFTGPLDQITVFGVLPGNLLDRELHDPKKERAQTRANAVALLQELQAALKGELASYRFEFDAQTSFTPANRGLLDACYVVDHKMHNGVDARDYMDLCNAVALFIYSFVGAGVGAEQASGQINVAIAQQPGDSGPDRCFRALGVSTLAYPVDDLQLYGVRYALVEWMRRWLGTEAAEDAVTMEVENAKTQLTATDTDSFVNQFYIEISGVDFAQSKGEQAALMALDDPTFIGKREITEQEFQRNVRACIRQIDDRATEIERGALNYVDTLATTIAGTSSSHARAVLGRLSTEVEKIQKDISTAKTTRQTDIQNLLNGFPGLERWINRLDFGLDRRHRRKYIQATQQLFRLRYFQTFNAAIEETIGSIVERLRHYVTHFDSLHQSIFRDYEQNAKFLSDLDNADSSEVDENQFGVVQQAMPTSQFRAWAEAVQLTWPDRFKPANTSKESLVEAVWQVLKTPFSEAIQQLNLLKEAQRQNEQAEREGMSLAHSLVNQIRALDSSAMPIIKLVDAAPLPEDMQPQKYAAGHEVRTSNRWVTSHFRPTAGGTRAVTALSIASTHMLLCTQTFSGFGAAHWEGYETARRYYDLDPWRAHALPESVQLSPLERLTQREVGLLRTIGIGLMSELLIEQSGGFYLNFRSDESVFEFSTFRKEPNAVAQQLIANKLIVMADESSIDPDTRSRLGSRLEDCQRMLTMPTFLPSIDRVATLVDRARSKIGTSWLKGSIEAFLKDGFGTKVAAAPQDRPLRDNIARVLREYAANL